MNNLITAGFGFIGMISSALFIVVVATTNDFSILVNSNPVNHSRLFFISLLVGNLYGCWTLTIRSLLAALKGKTK